MLSSTGESVSYGKSLAFVHRWDAFDEETPCNFCSCCAVR